MAIQIGFPVTKKIQQNHQLVPWPWNRWRSTFNTVLFVVFLILFTSLALSEPRDKILGRVLFLGFDSSIKLARSSEYQKWYSAPWLEYLEYFHHFLGAVRGSRSINRYSRYSYKSWVATPAATACHQDEGFRGLPSQEVRRRSNHPLKWGAIHRKLLEVSQRVLHASHFAVIVGKSFIQLPNSGNQPQNRKVK